MSQIENDLLYTQIYEFTQQFTYIYEPGVTFDINAFFQDAKDIKEYKIYFDKDLNHYMIEVKLEEFNIIMVRKIFSSFLHFMDYPGANIYAMKSAPNNRHYLLASLNKSGQGFYCEIDFSI
jgi:hypothetical protein